MMAVVASMVTAAGVVSKAAKKQWMSELPRRG
jgi:hypothetical protein